MTERVEIPPYVPGRGRRDGSYEDRFPRYAANAEREALFADQAVARWERSAGYVESAAENALRNGDPDAADLYQEMTDCARDAAECFRDMAKAAREIAEHYGKEFQ